MITSAKNYTKKTKKTKIAKQETRELEDGTMKPNM